MFKYQDNKKRTEKLFEYKKPLMSENDAIVESSRCLDCFDAPCIRGCPTAIEIPQFIKRIQDRNFLGSSDTILESNILGLSCSKVCPVEVLCEGACVYNHLKEPPIQIGRLQEYALHHFYKDPHIEIDVPTSKYKVALVGAGPASLSCAAYLSLSGVKTKIYEKDSLPGGLNTTGIAPYKLQVEDSMKEVEFIQSLGIEIKTNHPVEQSLAKELEQSNDAVFLGVGLGEDSIVLNVIGLDNVFGALEVISDIKLNESTFAEKYRSALVIGGGNTALDIAQELAGLNLSVTMAYRKSRREMSGYAHELNGAFIKGVKFLENHKPMHIQKTENKARAVTFETKAGNVDIGCDLLVFATGQKKHPLKELFPELELNSDGTVMVDAATFETSVPNIYAGGDCINAGKEVVDAVHDGRQAAFHILKKFNLEVKYGRFRN